jgi:hypothetical protein
VEKALAGAFWRAATLLSPREGTCGWTPWPFPTANLSPSACASGHGSWGCLHQPPGPMVVRKGAEQTWTGGKWAALQLAGHALIQIVICLFYVLTPVGARCLRTALCMQSLCACLST